MFDFILTVLIICVGLLLFDKLLRLMIMQTSSGKYLREVKYITEHYPNCIRLVQEDRPHYCVMYDKDTYEVKDVYFAHTIFNTGAIAVNRTSGGEPVLYFIGDFGTEKELHDKYGAFFPIRKEKDNND